MKTDLVGTFHVSIWPDDYGSDSESESPSETPPPQATPPEAGRGTGCLLSAIPQVIAKAELGDPGLFSAALNLEPLPTRVRKLVALRRKQMS